MGGAVGRQPRCRRNAEGLDSVVVAVGGILYLALTKQLFSSNVWRRLHLTLGAMIFLMIAAPWHILAMRESAVS